jgi:hypothetical protein
LVGTPEENVDLMHRAIQRLKRDIALDTEWNAVEHCFAVGVLAARERIKPIERVKSAPKQTGPSLSEQRAELTRMLEMYGQEQRKIDQGTFTGSELAKGLVAETIEECKIRLALIDAEVADVLQKARERFRGKRLVKE